MSSTQPEQGAIRVNGRRYRLEVGLTVEGLLAQLEITAQYALVELNGAPVPREDFGTVELSQADELVIARPVAGG